MINFFCHKVTLNLANPVFTQTEDAYIEEQKLVEEEEEDNIEEEMEMEEIEEENKTESTPVTGNHKKLKNLI